jgi:hypothetical protein
VGFAVPIKNGDLKLDIKEVMTFERQAYWENGWCF